MSFFFFSFLFLAVACNLDHANAGLACLVCSHHHHHQQGAAVMGHTFPQLHQGVPQQLLHPQQHSPAPHQLPGMTALAAADPGQQLHHQQQLAIASLAAAAGGVSGGVAATKKRQRESSEEMLLV